MHLIYILVTYKVIFSCTYQPVQWFSQDLVLGQLYRHIFEYINTVYSQNIENIAIWLIVILSKVGENLQIRIVRNDKERHTLGRYEN